MHYLRILTGENSRQSSHPPRSWLAAAAKQRHAAGLARSWAPEEAVSTVPGLGKASPVRVVTRHLSCFLSIHASRDCSHRTARVGRWFWRGRRREACSRRRDTHPIWGLDAHHFWFWSGGETFDGWERRWKRRARDVIQRAEPRGWGERVKFDSRATDPLNKVVG